MKVPARITIPRFPGGKRIAVTISFDDGHIYDRRIVKCFNEWGLKGTFNLNSGRLGRTGEPTGENSRRELDASEVADLYLGHEVAIHSVSHPSLADLDPSQMAFEILNDRKALEDIVGYPVRGMAYPNASFDDRVIALLKGLGIVYSRTILEEKDCFPPAEPLAWATTMHQYAKGPSVPERFQELYDIPWYSGVFFPWGHGYEFENRNDWDGLERIYRPLAGKACVWYCTNIELFDYEDARRRLIVAANRKTIYNPSILSVTVDVDGMMFDVLGGQFLQLSEDGFITGR